MQKMFILAMMAVALAGCTESNEASSGDEPLMEDSPAFETVYFNETGTLSAVPTLGSASSGEFEMPEGNAAFANFVGDGLDLVLTDPNGTQHGPGEIPVISGKWTWAITGNMAVQTDWSMSVQVTAGDIFTGYLSETVSVPPSQFFEINTQMPLAGTFCWDWSASADLAFDVHSHFDDEVQYLVEKTDSTDNACFTNEREGGYSLLWENGGAVPVSLTYTVWGDFEVDSYFPPR